MKRFKITNKNKIKLPMIIIALLGIALLIGGVAIAILPKENKKDTPPPSEEKEEHYGEKEVNDINQIILYGIEIFKSGEFKNLPKKGKKYYITISKLGNDLIENNKQEIELGTNPALADTDGDGLSDGDEINVYHTDALLADTDSDEANDGWEVENSFDPCLYNESFHVTVIADGGENSAVTAMVEMEATGKQASSLTVESVPLDDNILLSNSIPGYLGQAYEFFTCEEFDYATISFGYSTDIGQLNEQFQPRIYYFNESEGVLEELDNQTVTNRTVSVEVSHFSKYILLNKYLYDLAWESEIVLPSMAEALGVDVTTDSNDDGISDYYSNLIKQGKLLSSTGQNLFGGIDFNTNKDYDKDGVKDNNC